jgi:hypothetical protein
VFIAFHDRIEFMGALRPFFSARPSIGQVGQSLVFVHANIQYRRHSQTTLSHAQTEK